MKLPYIEDKRSFVLEILASVFTVSGIYLGSTTLPGACAYAVSLVFWFWVSYRKKLHGLLPLNVATTIVTIKNLIAFM